MIKRIVLGIGNVASSVFFLFIFFISTNVSEPLDSLGSFILAYFSKGVSLALAFVSAFIAYILLVKKERKKSYLFYLIVSFSPLLWFFLLYIGPLLAGNGIFTFVLFAFAGIIFYFLRTVSFRIAFVSFLVTLFMGGFALVSGFEEDYCWGKGTQADPSGVKLVVVSREDVRALKGYSMKVGEKIGVRFRAHMLCHATFNFIEAIRDRYPFTK